MSDTAIRDRAPAKSAAKPSNKATAPQKRQPTTSHQDEAAATAFAMSAFAREKYEFLLKALFALLGLLGLSILGNIYFAARDQPIRYFAMDTMGSVREVVPLSLPMQDQAEVVAWTAQSLSTALTMNFANYQQQLSDTRLLFDDAGWRGFEDALKRTKLLDTVISQKLVTSAAPAAAPVVLNSGFGPGGRYAWNVQVPIVVTYESASGRNSTTLNIDVVVIRRPESESPRGLGIAQIIAR